MQNSPILKTLADAIRVNSVNPNYDGGVNESAMADFVCRFFGERNIRFVRTEVLPDRPNVVVTLAGLDRLRRIVLEAHLDTVSTVGMTVKPHDPIVRDGRMYGRGSCDTKGGMVAMMHAVAEIAAASDPPPCDVVFAATIDEEYSYRGVVALCKSLTADVAIVAEPTELRAVVASKGLVRWKISAQGMAAHSAKPHLGVNAIEQIADLIQRLKSHQTDLQRRTHPMLDSPTLCVSLISGGEQINLVPDYCEIQIDRRLIPGETPESALKECQLIVDEACQKNGHQIEMHPPMLTDQPLDTPIDCEPVSHMASVLAAHGLAPTPMGVPFCSDASKFAGCGIPSIIFGPGSIDQAHAADEFVDCDQVILASQIYRDFIMQFPQAASS